MQTVVINCAYDEMVPLHKLVRNPRNPNKHPEEQLRLLAKIIDYQGWRNPIVVSSRSGFIVKGHARLDVAEMMGLEEAPVDYQDYESEAQEWADLLADNRIAELAEMDRPMLKDLLEEMDTGALDVELTGYTDQAIEDLMSEFHVDRVGLTDDDAVPDAPESICKRGDLWSLGNHRLLCGDATVKEDVERLMGGEKADMVFTDPPYNVNYNYTKYTDGRRMKHKRVFNDNLKVAEYIAFLSGIFINLYIYSKEDMSFYIWHSDKYRREYLNILEDVGFYISQPIIWVKNNHVLAMAQDYHRRYEASLYGWKKGQDHYKNMDCAYMNDVWQVDKDREYQHPTQKPVLLAEMGIKKSGKPKALVLEPFGGSGSTLIACEKLNRRCFMVELDEHYCDVIIERWQQFTGKQAVKVGND